jgi:rubredoxin
MSETIKFDCPKCGARHERGYHMAPDSGIFRCLGCGYVGHGHHPDPEIDAAIDVEIIENQAWNRAHGLPEGPRAP